MKIITLTLFRWADSCLSPPPPSENIFVYFLFDTYRLTITCKAIYRLTILLDYPLLDRTVVALVLIFAYLLCTSSESTPGRGRKPTWSGERLNFLSIGIPYRGISTWKELPWYLFAGEGVRIVAAIEYEPDQTLDTNRAHIIWRQTLQRLIFCSYRFWKVVMVFSRCLTVGEKVSALNLLWRV